MNRYIIVQDIVTRLTDDPVFRTFFTLYLMAETDVERETLDTRFWRDASELELEKQNLLRAELSRTFLRLPILIDQLHSRVAVSVL
ncbi:MAG: hypothetical protein H6574_10235 [Lewinellaceae bacterium]|nr:hypothetical protein [Saprospiraceae bacterium]MCB9314724.1 hypothetical protein [Lewinellaceae bacterium]MCB9331451.1 hypothetical protein [Lewinellaceae bacterium]